MNSGTFVKRLVAFCVRNDGSRLPGLQSSRIRHLCFSQSYQPPIHRPECSSIGNGDCLFGNGFNLVRETMRTDEKYCVSVACEACEKLKKHRPGSTCFDCQEASEWVKNNTTEKKVGEYELVRKPRKPRYCQGSGCRFVLTNTPLNPTQYMYCRQCHEEITARWGHDAIHHVNFRDTRTFGQ